VYVIDPTGIGHYFDPLQDKKTEDELARGHRSKACYSPSKLTGFSPSEGVLNKRHGEEVKAYVILKGEATLSEGDLVAWSKANMADYKYPRIIEFRETLPMTATGKILKSERR
jgi:acyl-CoA synthetase (AMP-forming)/AMP-acid ligase II